MPTPSEPQPTIRPARPDDAERVSALAILSKSVWGYTDHEMALFREELTISSDELLAHDGHVAELQAQGGEVVLCGHYTLVPIEGTEEGEGNGVVELNDLFVAANRLRRGIGSLLMSHAINRARARGFDRMRLISDPNSAGFYEHFGAVKVGDHQSSIPGRTIPILELDL